MIEWESLVNVKPPFILEATDKDFSLYLYVTDVQRTPDRLKYTSIIYTGFSGYTVAQESKEALISDIYREFGTDHIDAWKVLAGKKQLIRVFFERTF